MVKYGPYSPMVRRKTRHSRGKNHTCKDRGAGEKGAYTQPHPEESREPGAQVGFDGRAGSGTGLV